MPTSGDAFADELLEPVDSGEETRARSVGKSVGAFRTISEVSLELDVPQHVLRFWETKFVQLRPLKRGGGRRYYRPEDVALLRRIHSLLYKEGYTIKGVQRVLRTSRKVDREDPAKSDLLPALEIDAGDGQATAGLGDAEVVLREVLEELRVLRSLFD
jgi:DNA-binding transcriptional MerR regulator